MKKIFLFSLYLVIFFALVSAEKVCWGCYGQRNNQSEFLCHGQDCDVFYWPRYSSLPINLQCEPSTPQQTNTQCYIWAGLNRSKKYQKFVFLSHLTNTKSQQISFSFDQQGNAIIINADVENTKYQGQLASHPDISFQDVKEALNSNEFKILQKTVDVLRLKVGFYSLELKNALTMSFNQLKDSIKELTAKMNQQTIRNTDIQRLIRSQKDEISSLTNKLNSFSKLTQQLARTEKANEQLRTQISRYNKRLSDLQSLVSKQKSDMEGVARQASQATNKVAQVERVNNELKGKVGTLEKKFVLVEKAFGEGEKNLNVMSSKITAVQQRVSTNDQTINQLRQMFGMVHTRFNDFNKAFKSQKALIKKLNSKLATVTEGVEINQQEQEIEPFVIPQMNISSSTENITSTQTSNESIAINISSFIIPEYPLSQVFNHSKVITSKEETQTLGQFFGSRKIIKMQLLYRATQNQFSAGMFHKKCDKIADTLVVIETEYGKKIGGFTPLLWDGSKNGEYKADETSESFVFSLSNKDKFTLYQKDKAIWNHINYGPIFGSGADFSICDQANEKPLSYSDINRSYRNPNYKQRDRDSWQRFCGNTNNSWYFRVKEWEVWKVEFEQLQVEGAQL